MAGSARVLEGLGGLIQRERLGGALPGVLRGARDTGGTAGGAGEWNSKEEGVLVVESA